MPASRVTLPAEFYDITSPMMLRQPEPQYSWARLLFAANARAELEALNPGALFGGRGPQAQGAGVPSLADMQLVLAQNPLAEAIAVVQECGQKGVGHTVRLNRPLFSDTTYTEASRTIKQSDSISTVPVDVQAEQVSLTVKKFAGPYDQSNSRVAPYAIDRFDSGKSVHSLAGLVGLHLSRDRMKTVDRIVRSYFDLATTNIVRAGNISADASFPTSGEQPLDFETLTRAKEKLKNASIPTFAGGFYLCGVSPTQMRQLQNDPDFVRAAKEVPELNPVLNSSVKLLNGDIAIFESSTIVTDTATVNGQTIYRGVMFGPGAVGYGLDDPARCASSNDDNYGETAKVIWLAYEAYGALDERFLCSIRSV